MRINEQLIIKIEFYLHALTPTVISNLYYYTFGRQKGYRPNMRYFDLNVINPSRRKDLLHYLVVFISLPKLTGLIGIMVEIACL